MLNIFFFVIFYNLCDWNKINYGKFTPILNIKKSIKLAAGHLAGHLKILKKWVTLIGFIVRLACDIFFFFGETSHLFNIFSTPMLFYFNRHGQY